MTRLRVLVYVCVLGLTLAAADPCLGAGFALYEGSARGNALGGALVAKADDPSALFFNPAGITQLPGLQMMAGATFIMPTTDVKTTSPYGTTTTSTESNVWVPPHLYATYQAAEKVWLGLGLFSPFGLGTEFNENWPGRYNSYKAVIQTININPTIALKLTDTVSMAAGLNFMWFDLDLRNKIRLATPTGFVLADNIDQTLKGDSFGYGMNFGLRYKPFDCLAFGVAYRTQVQQNVKGDATFTPNNTPYFKSTSASGMVTLPDMLSMSAVVYPIKELSVEFGTIFTRWSSYSDLTIHYDTPQIFGNSVTRLKNWRDVWRMFVGVEYKAADWLDLRASYVYDQEPAETEYADYLVPANNRQLFSIGPGFHWRNWTLDLSYTYLYIISRDVPTTALQRSYGMLPSEFTNGYANMVGVSLGYKF